MSSFRLYVLVLLVLVLAACDAEIVNANLPKVEPPQEQSEQPETEADPEPTAECEPEESGEEAWVEPGPKMWPSDCHIDWYREEAKDPIPYLYYGNCVPGEQLYRSSKQEFPVFEEAQDLGYVHMGFVAHHPGEGITADWNEHPCNLRGERKGQPRWWTVELW